jgi:hypothetical protein
MQEETLVEDPSPIAQEDVAKSLFSHPGSEVASDVSSKFQRSKSNKSEAENRFLKAYMNFRGRYGEDVEFLDTEISRVFIKITKTKTLAAYGQLLDVLLGGPRFPISVAPTENPVDSLEAIHIDPAQPEEPDMEESLEGVDVVGYEGDGNDIDPNESLMDRMRRIAAKALHVGDREVNIKEGGAKKPGQITLNPSKLAAEGMTKKIQDQLTETKMPREFRKFLFEMTMLGSGCLKGPFHEEKEYPRWDKEGNYDPVMQKMPVSKFVSIWNIYNDPDASSVEDSEWIIERHKMSKSELRGLKRKPLFKADAINAAVEIGSNYREEDWELTLQEGIDSTTSNKFEVLEYWGVMDTEMLSNLEGLKLPKEIKDQGEANVNVFVCNGILIRVVVNPFKPARIPYYVCPYEEDPYNFFGCGLPENMEDSQTLCNGFARMGVDNSVLAGSVMLEVDSDNLVDGTTMDIYPGKVWHREGGGPGQTVNSITFPNTANSNMMMYDKFRQLCDESTGISSFSHGQTGVSGVGRTAAGISMLMGAASGSIKTVIKNIDDYVLEPMGNAYFAWNNQFDFDETLLGDLEVKAQGVSSLMAKEVKSQRMISVIQVAAMDQELSMRLNKEYFAKELVRTMELDTDLCVLSEEEYQLKVSLGMYEPQAQPPQSPAGMPSDKGGIGVPTPSLPGEQGFSGSPQAPQEEEPVMPPEGMPQ